MSYLLNINFSMSALGLVGSIMEALYARRSCMAGATGAGGIALVYLSYLAFITYAILVRVVGTELFSLAASIAGGTA